MMMLDGVAIAIVETLMARLLGMGMDAAMEREGFDPIGARRPGRQRQQR